MFTEKERAYIRSQRLARIGTVDGHGQVDVSPVGYEFDGEHFYIGSGYDSTRTRKHRNVVAGNTKVAVTIDDIVSLDPWAARGIRVHGRAEVIERDGAFFKGSQLKITPAVHWSWGIEDDIFVQGEFVVNRVAW